MIRVFLADDHAVVREGLKRILAENADIEVVGETGTGNGLAEACLEADPDVILLDITMPGPGFLELLKELKAAGRAWRVLVLSVHSEDFFALRAFRAGASGYLTKDHSPEELPRAIRRIHEGGRYLTPDLAEKLVFDLYATSEELPHQTLSDREFQVLLRLAVGRSAKSIAHELGVSPKTVSTYRARLLEKLGLRSDAELVRYALEHGLVT